MNIIPKPLLAVLILISVVFGASYLWDTNFFGLVPYSYEQYAEKVIAACAKENYPPSCYDNEIPKLMDRGLSMEETFEVTSIIQGKVNNYFYCHVLGHRLSEKETAKDPLKWTEVVARCPTGMCSNGCLHGAAQERFRNDVLTPEQVQSLLPELTQVCEEGYGRAFTGLEQASCYHSLGHLSMYITGADADASVAVCDDIAQKGRVPHGHVLERMFARRGAGALQKRRADARTSTVLAAGIDAGMRRRLRARFYGP
jgi:hypothetical protein